jgi:hypothetical protein
LKPIFYHISHQAASFFIRFVTCLSKVRIQSEDYRGNRSSRVVTYREMLVIVMQNIKEGKKIILRTPVYAVHVSTQYEMHELARLIFRAFFRKQILTQMTIIKAHRNS